ncbi:MAG: TPM domain-containing protein [Caldilineaceae bacterium]|nr:TPM domain-containing protein [Caldilineaceae bacterium]
MKYGRLAVLPALAVMLILVMSGCGGRNQEPQADPAPVAVNDDAPAQDTVDQANNDGAADASDAAVAATEPVTGTEPAAPSDESDSAFQEVQDLLGQMQACSYDGTPVRFDMGGQAPADCIDMVGMVMHYIGLPQNFDVTEAGVPNAAAAILLGDDDLPHRVIAFNPDFIDGVDMATDNPWGAVSILAHEVGHHLSGHTIQPGGSQPPTELEADKFSGFVLQKMGAGLDDALVAVNTFVPEEDGETHPGRSKRIVAITEGWMQACMQIGRTDCKGGAAGASASAVAMAQPQADPATDANTDTAVPAEETAVATAEPVQEPIEEPTEEPTEEAVEAAAEDATAEATAETIEEATAAPVETASAEAGDEPQAEPTERRVDLLPHADPEAIPSKTLQFVYDELGILDPATVAAFEQQLYAHAQEWGVEIAVLLTDDLEGYTADEFAWHMMRQLRVGKLDVGNGAVLVYAPEQGEFGLALGPGVMGEMMSYVDMYRTRADRFLAEGYGECLERNGCDAGRTELFFSSADHIRQDTDVWEWTIRYQSFAEMQAAFVAAEEKRAEENVAYDPLTDPVWRKIARLRGVVQAINVTETDSKFVNPVRVEAGYIPVLAVDEAGVTFMFYVLPSTMGLQPAGELAVGREYVFIAREMGAYFNDDPQSFELLSYDLTLADE